MKAPRTPKRSFVNGTAIVLAIIVTIALVTMCERRQRRIDSSHTDVIVVADTLRAPVSQDTVTPPRKRNHKSTRLPNPVRERSPLDEKL